MATLARLRLPFLPLVLCAIAGILAAEFLDLPALFWPAMAGMALLWFLLTRGYPSFALLCFSLFALLHLWQSSESAASLFARWLGTRSAPVEITGTIVSEPRTFWSKSTFELQVEKMLLDGVALEARFIIQVEAQAGGLAYGNKIQVRGDLTNLEPPRNPGQFDYSSWLAQRDIHTQLTSENKKDLKIIFLQGGNPLVKLAAKAREWMRQTLTLGVNDQVVSDLLVGMVLGETSNLPQTIQEQFRGTGTYHLFSVSGLHVGILATILWYVCKFCRISRRQAALIIIPILFFYALMTGLKSASIRSTIMASIILAGMISNRRPIILNSLLAAAFLILIWDTNQLFNAGFQLSFCVVAAIIILEPPVRHYLAAPFQHDPFLPEKLLTSSQRYFLKAGKAFAALVAVSMAAWMGSLFLTLGYFHMVSLTALPANLIAVPISFCIMAVALLSLMAAPFSAWVTAVYNQANWLLSKVLLAVISFCASIPGSFFYVKTPQFPAPIAEIVIFDFGAGGCAGIFMDGKSFLLDVGPAFQHDNVLLPYLRSQGVHRLDSLLISHGDPGHLGALRQLLVSCRPGKVIDSALGDPSSSLETFRQEVEKAGIRRSPAKINDTIPVFPSAEIKVLYPPSQFVPLKVADDAAMVLSITIGNTRILFMSDARTFTEDLLVQHSHNEIRSDILVQGWPTGGKTANMHFIAAVAPRLVISAAPTTTKKFPPSFADELAKRNITLYRQDRCGAVTIKVYSDHWEASTFLSKQHYRQSR